LRGIAETRTSDLCIARAEVRVQSVALDAFSMAPESASLKSARPAIQARASAGACHAPLPLRSTVDWIMIRRALAAVLLIASVNAAAAQDPPAVLPDKATSALAASLKAAAAHKKHIWTSLPPFNDDGTVNGYIEIARGDRRKYELDIAANKRKVDRIIPKELGGYPINYGIVPQTISYDGDPFDVLVLGPAIGGGRTVRGVIVGVMFMEDEKGLDSKVVISRVDRDGKPLHQLTPEIQREVGEYFKRYKDNQPGMFSKVPGWGTAEQGKAYVATTHLFFKNCRQNPGRACQVDTSRQ
jgi:inorganic pyrophosphatase